VPEDSPDRPRLLPEEVGAVLPDAIVSRAGEKTDRRLVKALSPSVEDAVKTAFRRDPKSFADALMPGLGPAIRKVVAENFKKMIEQINRALDYSLSREGIKWRIEARRTGKSLAEVVLYHTLVYRVEQVFLIHNETGLLLNHAVLGSAAVEQPDMVSGMLTAIQDFVKDSFRASGDDVLQSLEVGELAVWVERGPAAMLAAVIRGNAPVAFRERLQSALETIHTQFAGEFATFIGDTSVFEDCRPLLESCLAEVQRRPKKSRTALVVLLALVGLAGGWPAYRHIRERLAWARYFRGLQAEPGIVISEIRKGFARYEVSGLRDPLAPDPEVALKAAGLDAKRVVFRWEPYTSLHSAFVIARAKEVLQPPDTVVLRLEGTTLVAAGPASRKWIEQARAIARALPGVTRFAEEELVDLDRSAYEVLVWKSREKDFAEVASRLQRAAVPFREGAVDLSGGAEAALQEIRDLIVKLLALGDFLGKNLAVELVARAEDASPGPLGEASARRRMHAVAKGLVAGGVNAARLQVHVEPANAAVADPDAVSFRVLERRRAR
jgi:OOP family OmpA-OmpF porin